jgi:hypothetical protein
MHRTIAILFFVLTLGLCVPARGQIKPVIGKPVEILFRPDPSSPLAKAESIQLVYVFNYWGSRTGTRLALLENVLRPDTSRVKRLAMKKTDIGWSATIDALPDYAAVLSYYFTDGTTRDDNGERTYAWYVVLPNGNPVRNAHFFMNYFLELGRESIDRRVKEAEDEITAYPENFKTYTQYFTLFFEQGKAGEHTRNRILEKLEQLERDYPENTDVLNLIAHTQFYILRNTETGLQYRNRIPVSNLWPDVLTMFDRDKKLEEQRRVADDRKRRREALMNTQLFDVRFMDFALHLLPLRLDSGSVQVLTFWATASEQSKRMFEPLERMQKRFEGKPLKISLINVDPDWKAGQKFIESKNLPFQQRMHVGSTLIELGVDGIPHTIVLDKSGFVRKIIIGFTDETEPELLTILEQLL